jgi:hypothetical protein
MKWKNHQMVGYGLAYAVTGNFLLSMISIPMSVLPDAIEGVPKLKIFKHRGWSHNILLWCAISVLLLFWGYYDEHLVLAIAAIMGPISHLLCDAFSTSGIPLWKNKTLKGELYSVGSTGEYLIAIGTLAAAFFYRSLFLEGPTAQIEYAMEETQNIFYLLTQPHFATWFISILPYNLIAIAALIVAVWMIVFREIFAYGIGIIFLSIVLFFVGQYIT